MTGTDGRTNGFGVDQGGRTDTTIGYGGVSMPGSGRTEAARSPGATTNGAAAGLAGAPPLVVNVAPLREANGWRWFESDYVGRVRWEFFDSIPRNALERAVRRPDLALSRSCGEAVLAARRGGAKLLISHDPRATLRCGLSMRVTGAPLPHVAWSFNLSKLPTGLTRRLMVRAFSGVDRFVVFSTMERELYSREFGIPAEKIDVILWGVGEPPVDRPEVPVEPGDYISAVGGNARDYPLLMAAMARLPDVRLVAVMRPGNAAGLAVPPNVSVRVNRPLGETNNLVKHSRFMVLPLAGSQVPCGHVTLVNAMLLRKAFVVTDSSGVRDYVQEGVNCLTFEAHSVDDLARRVRELWDDPGRCSRLGENGRLFAEVHCGEAASRSHLDRVLNEFGVL
jgi:hypothetical protein